MEDILERIPEANSQEVGHRPLVKDILERIHDANSQQVGTGSRWRIFWRGYLRSIGKRWA